MPSKFRKESAWLGIRSPRFNPYWGNILLLEEAFLHKKKKIPVRVNWPLLGNSKLVQKEEVQGFNIDWSNILLLDTFLLSCSKASCVCLWKPEWLYTLIPAYLLITRHKHGSCMDTFLKRLNFFLSLLFGKSLDKNDKKFLMLVE